MDVESESPKPGDTSEDVRWVSYEELAEARRISVSSARSLALRRRWPKRQGNDGTSRVLVPTTSLVEGGDTKGDDAETVALAALDMLREQLDRAYSDLKAERQSRESLLDELKAERQSRDSLLEQLAESRAENAVLSICSWFLASGVRSMRGPLHSPGLQRARPLRLPI